MTLSLVSLAVWLVPEMLHPVDDPAVPRFPNGDVCHCRGRRGPMPVLLTRRKPDNIAWPSMGPSQRRAHPAPDLKNND